jgi:hypothetical protein
MSLIVVKHSRDFLVYLEGTIDTGIVSPAKERRHLTRLKAFVCFKVFLSLLPPHYLHMIMFTSCFTMVQVHGWVGDIPKRPVWAQVVHLHTLMCPHL